MAWSSIITLRYFKLLENKGIKTDCMNDYPSEQNDVTEHFNYMTLFCQSNVKKQSYVFWAEAQLCLVGFGIYTKFNTSTI